MRRSFLSVAALAFAATSVIAVGCASHNERDEDRDEPAMTLDQTPAPVRDTITRTANGAAITKVKQENEDGQVVYEAKYTSGGAKHSISVDPNGRLLENEEKIAAASLPQAVSNAITHAIPGGQIGDAEKVTSGDGKTAYEVDVVASGQKHEVKVGADGTVLSNKVEQDEDDEHDGREHGEHS